MKRRKFLLGSSALLASGAALTSADAFSATEAHRDVQIAVVGDSDAYLGLTEDENEDEGLLYGAEMPRTVPETFEITNQSANTVDIHIELLYKNLVFTDATSGDDVEDITVEDHAVTIEGMIPGSKVTAVEVDVSGAPESSVSDTLSFDVAGVDGGIHIDAKRTLELEPDELEADISIGSLNANFDIGGIDDVNRDTVTATIGDQTFETTQTGGSGKFKIEAEKSDVSDCESSNKVDVTITGETEHGISFSGTASDVTCSEGGGHSGNEGNGKSSESQDEGSGNEGNNNSDDES